MKSLVLALALLTSTAQASSFNEVRDSIYAQPLSTPPLYFCRGLLETLRVVAFDVVGGLVGRIKTTLREPSDFKETGVKPLHPMGVCAEGEWAITETNSASGLLSKGTDVRAIVRMSAGDDHVALDPLRVRGRIFGLAVKLFPAQDDDASVQTRNLFTLDQNGLDASFRDSYLTPDLGDDQTVYFTNIAAGKGLLAVLGNKFFGQFDWNPTRRPLYPLTEVTSRGEAVPSPNTPTELRLYPHVSSPLKGFSADFRTELAQAAPGQIYFDIILPAQSGFGSSGQRIGRLTLGKPVMSVACDQELHFHHHPNNRATAN